MAHAHAGFTTVNFSNLKNASQEELISTSCTVPEGLPTECARVLTLDCHQIEDCKGDRECIANRTRVDISSCEAETSKPTKNQFIKSSSDRKTELTESPAQPTSTSSKISPEQVSAQDPSQLPDSQPCITALANARRACDTSQASSFSNQVSGGSQGLTGAAVATTGTQNINNIIVNCSNSQQICASACSQAQLPDQQNQCQILESNLKYLANAADTSFDSASNELTQFPTSSPYYLDGKMQNANASNDYEAAKTQTRSREGFGSANQLLKDKLSLSPAEVPAPPTVAENMPSIGEIDSRLNPTGTHPQEDYAFESSLGIPKPYAPGAAGPLINGTAGVAVAGAGSTRGTVGKVPPQSQITGADLATFSGGGYSPPTLTAIGSTTGNDYNHYSKIDGVSEQLRKGYSIFANWRSSIRDAWEDFLSGPVGSKARTPASDRGRLGNDYQLAMESLPDVPRSHLPDVVFGATIFSLSALGLWRLKTLLALKGALKVAQLAEQAQRRMHQRRANEMSDRRIQSSLFREGEAERRKSSSDRRSQQRRLVPRSS